MAHDRVGHAAAVSDEEEQPSAFRELAEEIGSSLANEIVKTAAQLQGLDPMTAAMAGGAAGGTVKGVTSAAVAMFRRRRNRGLAALAAGQAEAGLPPEELLERALEDDRKLDLLGRAIEAATREADERRVRFYGRIAASGVLAEDDAKIDTAARVFSTLADLDAADLKVLLLMAEKVERPWIDVDPDGRKGGDVYFELESELPELMEVMDSVLSRLTGLGLVSYVVGGRGGGTYNINPFGELCVRKLTEGGGEDVGDEAKGPYRSTC